MKSQRVFITGLGALGAGFSNVEQLWDRVNNLRNPMPGNFETDLEFNKTLAYVCETEFDTQYSRSTGLALKALEEAVADAGIREFPAFKSGVFAATALGTIDRFEQSEPADNDDITRCLFELSEVVAQKYTCLGPNQVFSTACAASLHAVDSAMREIQERQADVILVVGTEICSKISLGCFNRLGGLDSSHCRPFDKDREGTVFGEGAFALILESESHYCQRGGNKLYGEVLGAGVSCDGFHATAPEPQGEQIKKAMGEALTTGGQTAAELQCIIPHGTGTALNDQIEAQALIELLGARSQEVPVFPVKASLGHSAGAAGAASLVIAANVSRNGQVPPVSNLNNTEYALRFPTETIDIPERNSVLVNGYGFGGNNASVLIGDCSDVK